MDIQDLLVPLTPIDSTQELVKFTDQMKKLPYIVVDTEFMRERTYWPELCLIQIAGGDLAAIIDPKAAEMDLTPLLDIIAAPEIIKVFHSGRQDLEVFYQLSRKVPQNVADTQIMAMALGYGDSVGYEALIKDILNIQIDKGARFTDWSQRPLTTRQLKYALSDVTYLLPAYEKLHAELVKRNRLAWIEEEINYLINPANYTALPEEAWRRLKIRNDKPRFLAVLKEIAAWREREAQARNLPRQRIVKDDALLEIAVHPPDNRTGLNSYRALPKEFGSSILGEGLWDSIEKGLNLPKDQIPRLPSKPSWQEKPGPAADLLKVFIKHICQINQVSPKLLASTSELDILSFLKEEADIPLLNGWRYELCGEEAIKLLKGRISMALTSDGIRLIPLDNSLD